MKKIIKSISFFILFTTIITSCTQNEVLLPEENSKIEKSKNNTYQKRDPINTYDDHRDYSPSYAVRYGLRYYSGGEEISHFPRFINSEGTNCTNFVNQCLMAGFTRSSYAPTVWSRGTLIDDTEGNTEMYEDWNRRSTSKWYCSSSWFRAEGLYKYINRDKYNNRSGLYLDLVTEGKNGEFRVSDIEPGDIIFIIYEGDTLNSSTAKSKKKDHVVLAINVKQYPSNNYSLSRVEFVGHDLDIKSDLLSTDNFYRDGKSKEIDYKKVKPYYIVYRPKIIRY